MQGLEEWSPSTSHEYEWYKALFRLADTDNKGQIAGQAAVEFLSRSGLNFSILKEVRPGKGCHVLLQVYTCAPPPYTRDNSGLIILSFSTLRCGEWQTVKK